MEHNHFTIHSLVIRERTYASLVNSPPCFGAPELFRSRRFHLHVDRYQRGFMLTLQFAGYRFLNLDIY